MRKLLRQLKKKARQDPKIIVFPESADRRIRAAACDIVSRGYANVILLGDVPPLRGVERSCSSARHAWMQVVDHRKSPLLKEFAKQYYLLHRDKGMTLKHAQVFMQDPLYFGTMLVRNGKAHGIISGATHSKTITLKPVLQLLSTPGKRVSSFFLMKRQDHYYLFADASVNIDPNPEELADIAITTADSAKHLFNITPRVALLSFSTHGSNNHPAAQKVRTAAALAIKHGSRYQIDGELQADAALFPGVCRFKCNACRLKGRANILIFPDLNAANIAYKLVEWLGKYEAIGPILQGLQKPANDLSRGCTVKDIIDLAVITVVQAQYIEHRQRRKKER